MKKLKISCFILSALMIIFLFNCTGPAKEDKDDDEKETNTVIAEYLGLSGSTTFYWGRDPSSNKVEWCQSFKISSNSTCSAVELKLGTRSETPTGDYTIRIETNNVDRPSGTLIDPNAVKTIAASGLTDLSWNKWSFNTPFNLVSNTTYWIVCRTNEPIIENNRIHIIGDQNTTYTTGDTAFYANDNYAATYNDQDICFRVYQ